MGALAPYGFLPVLLMPATSGLSLNHDDAGGWWLSGGPGGVIVAAIVAYSSGFCEGATAVTACQ